MSPLLEIRGVTKSYSGVQVLHGVSLVMRPAEVHAVLGENGAGKSTLMKILSGVHRPDSGEIRLRDRRVQFRNPHAALRAGVAMIYQELLPVLDMSLAENIFLGHEPGSAFFGWINKRARSERAERWLAQGSVGISPAGARRDLRVAEMQAVEIAKA